MKRLFILLFVLVFANSLSAMVSVKMSEKEKINKATAIVEVKCKDVKTEWGGKEKKVIFTRYEVEPVAVPLKGSLPKDWTGFTLPGGTVGKETMSVEGVAKLELGKIYILFLDSIYMPIGEQGVYRVKNKKVCYPDSKKCVSMDKFKKMIK